MSFYFLPESLSQEDLTIHLNRGMAKRLHHCWAATLQEKFAKEERSIQSMIEQGTCYSGFFFLGFIFCVEILINVDLNIVLQMLGLHFR